MGLPETFEAVRPSIIAFISRMTVIPPGGTPPLFPEIFGTGFLVHESGIAVTNRHVIEAIETVNLNPLHPETGGRPVGALIFTEITNTESEHRIGMLNVDLLGWNTLGSFSSNNPWFGEDVPDIGFVQLNVRDVPTLALATEPGTLRTGMPIATAGFPLGDRTVTFHRRITQMTPVLRHGIVSSVFPFGGAHPHGFSIDALLQSGASGSPVFLPEKPLVVGMIASRLPDTNFTVAVPSHLLAGALSAAITKWETFPDIPRLCDLIESGQADGDETLTWSQYPLTKIPDDRD
jgi:S1-C subfamily serine protease